MQDGSLIIEFNVDSHKAHAALTDVLAFVHRACSPTPEGVASTPLVSVDDRSKTVRALEREADTYYGLEPGTNGTGAIMRRMGIGEPDYRWIRFGGRPAVGVTLIPTNTSDSLTSNPWSGKPCQLRAAKDEESEHVPDLDAGAIEIESDEELIAQVGDVLATQPYGVRTKRGAAQSAARVNFDRSLKSNPVPPSIDDLALAE